MDLPRLLEERSSTASAIFALGRRPLSYTSLFEHCAATTALLNGAGVSRGDRVAVVLPNGPEMATCFLAVAMGASCAPLNPTYRRNEFELLFLRPGSQGADSPGRHPVSGDRGGRIERNPRHPAPSFYSNKRRESSHWTSADE